LLYRDNQLRLEGIHVIAEQYLLGYEVDDMAYTKHMILLYVDSVLGSQLGQGSSVLVSIIRNKVANP
jgi:hypothetical protein